MEKLHVVYATDSRYLFPTYVAASSAVLFASERGKIVLDIFDCGISDADWFLFASDMRRNMGEEFGLERHVIDMKAYDGLKRWHTSLGIYARLDIPQLLPEVDWCVYADGDTLFTADPLELCRVWNPKFAIMGHHDDGLDLSWYAKNGFPCHPDTQICAGFILLNLNWFRANGGTAKCFDLLRRYPDMPYNDQDALNITCDGLIGLLPDNWGKFTYDTNRDTVPGLFHYVSDRPWELKTNGFLPLRGTDRIWFKIKAMSTGTNAWSCPGLPSTRYFVVWAKTFVISSIVRVLNVLPVLRGRFTYNLRRTWSKRFVARFLPKVSA